MKLKLYIRNSDKSNIFMLEDSFRNNQIKNEKGFTLLELMVTLFIGLIIGVIGMSSLTLMKINFIDDMSRVGVNQNSRSSLDMIGIALREAGENLASNFPAIEVSEENNNSQLTIRRNLVDEVLKLCTQIDAGSNNNEIYFAVSGTQQGCTREDLLHNYNTWKEYRENNTNTKAYIYNSSTKSGEFFNYISEHDTGNELFLITESKTWENTYSSSSSAIYLLEEWIFRLDENIIQIIENGENDNPLNVADKISSLKVEVNMTDGSTLLEFTPDNNWTNIQNINVEIMSNVIKTAKGKSNYQNTLRSRFFPRNILSH